MAAVVSTKEGYDFVTELLRVVGRSGSSSATGSTPSEGANPPPAAVAKEPCGKEKVLSLPMHAVSFISMFLPLPLASRCFHHFQLDVAAAAAGVAAGAFAIGLRYRLQEVGGLLQRPDGRGAQGERAATARRGGGPRGARMRSRSQQSEQAA
eukprot:GHVU01137691.1.p1 GENE.GHVU01137691.1~~GHVU01137691.1.p1  ORF type:complete len:152 (+),score=18.41 GHVU01137691.1:129-584(+)